MKKCTTYTLGSTKVTKETDCNPDISFLGEYGSTFKAGCIVRADDTFYEDHIDDDEYEAPSMGHHEYDFFYPPDNGEPIGSDEYKKYALQDYKEMEGLNDQQWTFVNIDVKTHITTDTGLSDYVCNSLSGVDDHWDKDSDDYHKEIIADLLAENKSELLKMGFSEVEIQESFKTINEL